MTEVFSRRSPFSGVQNFSDVQQNSPEEEKKNDIIDNISYNILYINDIIYSIIY